MSFRQKPLRRAALPLLISLGVALLFCLQLRRSTYLSFPRQIIVLKGDRSSPSPASPVEFAAEKGVEGNIWVLEAEFFERVDERPGIRISLNGTALPRARVGGKKLRAEFPASFLNEGKNVLELIAAEGLAYRRLRIRNIYGYSRGLISGVTFNRSNIYPECRLWPSGLQGSILLVLSFLLLFGLNFFPASGVSLPGPRLKDWRTARFLIPALFLALIILPAATKYRAWLELRSALILVFLFYALVYIPELDALINRYQRSGASLFRFGADPAAKRDRSGSREDSVSTALLLCFAFLTFVYPGPNHSSGDSPEYCAMLVGWSEHLSPRITADSLAKTVRLFSFGSFSEERDAFNEWKEKFPALVRNDSVLYLPHFWLYSLAAAVFYWPVRLLSLDIGLSFMLVHLILLMAAFSYVRRRLGPAAGLGLMLVIFLSPLFWFINKTQVEFVTVILAVLGVAFFISENPAASAFVFALASTQNPPFAILSVLVFVLGFTRNKWTAIRDGPLLWLGTLLLAVLQPAYYFLSVGVLNPVVASGGATFEQEILSPKRMFSVIIDPDIGLLANWPLSLFLLAALFILVLRRQSTLTGRTWIFLFLSAAVLLWSQSRTTNFNHGGTYNISRYAVWYLYVFFLSIWQVYRASFRMARRPRQILVGVGLAVGLLVMTRYWPGRVQQCLKPTGVSRLLYKHVPNIYDPVPEIFIERLRGIEGNPPPEVWAVSNPSGNKILILGERLASIPKGPIPHIDTNSNLNRSRVYREARKARAGNRGKAHFYIDGKGREFWVGRPKRDNGFEEVNPCPRVWSNSVFTAEK